MMVRPYLANKRGANMQKMPFTLLVVLAAMTLQASTLFGDDTDTKVIAKAPELVGYTYRCEDAVRVVNHLRSLGKDKALDAMTDYLAHSAEIGTRDHRVWLVCELLFVNPKGWNGVGKFGAPEPEVGRDAAGKFPSFPFGYLK